MDVLKDVARRDKRNVILNELSEEDLNKTVVEYYYTYIEKPLKIKERELPKFDKTLPKFGVLKSSDSVEIGSFLNIDDLFFSFDGIQIPMTFNNRIFLCKDERQVFYSNREYEFKEVTSEECSDILKEIYSLRNEWNKLFDVDMEKLLVINFPKRIVKPLFSVYLDKEYLGRFSNQKLKDIYDRQMEMFSEELEQYEKNLKLVDFLYDKLIYTDGKLIIPTAKSNDVSGLSGIVFSKDFFKEQIEIIPNEDAYYYIYDDETAEEIKNKINKLNDDFNGIFNNLILKIEEHF